MPTNNDEIERLKRLRDQQIRTRYDPNEKKAKFEQISYQRRQGAKVTRQNVLKDIPDKVWWALASGLIGVLFYVIITHLPDMPAYGPLLGLGGIVFFVVVGWILGAAHDTGKDDWGRRVPGNKDLFGNCSAVTPHCTQWVQVCPSTVIGHPER